MSTYYKIEINGELKKVRVSEHEPNERLNGSSDIEFYTKDACGSKLSIGGQIDYYCDKRDLDFRIFEKIIRDFAEEDEECFYMEKML